MRDVAAACPAVRHVLGLGGELPDGVQPIDGAPSHGVAIEGCKGAPRYGNPADHVAIVTFRQDADGPAPLARSHNQWLAAAGALASAAGIRANSRIATTMLPTGLAGLAGGLASWLHVRCGMILLAPSNLTEAAAAARHHRATHLTMPGRVAACGRTPGDMRLVRMWNDATQAADAEADEAAVDVVALGEIALLAACGEERSMLALGPADGGTEAEGMARFVHARLHGQFQRADASVAAGSLLSGALRLGGPQAPGHRFPVPRGWEAEAGAGMGQDGFWPSGLRARLVSSRPAAVRVSGHLREIAMCGAVPIALDEADRLYAGFPGFGDAACLPLPDPALGTRLAAAAVARPGHGVSLEGLCDHLEQSGAGAHLMPSRLVLVHRLPRAGDGAVLRDAMRESCAA